MTTYVITRHAAASDFVARKGFSGAQVVAHAADDFWAGLKIGDVVVGTLPIHLAARACEITGSPFGFLEVNVPADARGRELSLEEMERFGATISWWSIQAAQPPKSE
ncbi:MAG TPA: CRISPR-associated protein Csx16 [Candidatus Paceibacterota bacterium]|nr:CRISPR-associated protein Csx16 [Candidatus Paceibacterota bacterium]